MRVRRPGAGFGAVRAVFMAVRVSMPRPRLAGMLMGMHRAVGVTVRVSVRLAFEPDFV